MRDLPESVLESLSASVAQRFGLHFPPGRWKDLERGLWQAALRLGLPDLAGWAARMTIGAVSRHEIEILAGELTIGETYFLREPHSFDALSDHILPDLIQSRSAGIRQLRIWSAGCCTGEEPYSVAILLDRLLPDQQEWQIAILGTDVNTAFLKKARKGVFTEWSFRDAPPWLKERYFAPAGEHQYELLPRIRERVTFETLNLAVDPYPSFDAQPRKFDLILCRNVLIYFTPESGLRTAQGFHRSLEEGGWLMVSPTEVSHAVFSAFTAVTFKGAVLYRKTAARAAPPAPVPPVWPSGDASLPVPAWAPAAAQSGGGSRPANFVSAESAWPSARSRAAPPASLPPSPYDEALELFAQGDYEGSAQRVRADAERPEAPAEQVALMARICANLDRTEEARSWAERAVAAEKLNAGLRYLLALVLQEQDADPEAEAALRQAVYLEPDFVLAHFALASLATRHQRPDAAAREFDLTLQLLRSYRDDETLPHSDGLAAGQLREMIETSPRVGLSS